MFPDNDLIYGLCILAGIAAGFFVVLQLIFKKYNMTAKSAQFYTILGLISAGIGFLGAILFQFIYDVFDPSTDITAQGYAPGMTFLGGLITAAAVFFIALKLFGKPEQKKEFWIVARAFAPSLIIAHAFGRLGCFLHGCCYGKPTESFIGIKFPALGQKVVPTQLIECIFLIILFIFTYVYTNKSLIIYLLSYGIFRFILEFFRGDHRGQLFWQSALSPSQILCIVMVTAGIVLLILDIRKRLFKKPDCHISENDIKKPAIQETDNN